MQTNRSNPLRLLSLPHELLIHITSYLPPESVIALHSTSRQLRNLTRADPTLWRSLCAYQETLQSEAHSDEPLVPFLLPFEPARPSSLWAVSGEHVGLDWYNEYKYRYAPVKTRWLSPSEDEVKGLAAFSICGDEEQKNGLVAPLEDGSVVLWSLQNGRREIARSSPGLLHGHSAGRRTGRKTQVAEIGDSVVVDEVMRRIWVAGEEGLVELDLNTLQKISTTRFPFAIATLSQSAYPHPLTIATTLTLHLHDSRLSNPTTSTTLPQNYSNHVALHQPGPLAVLHHSNDNIYVAGRFPSILSYDRRLWPRLESTIHSGGRLCTLAAYGNHTLLAGGEYNGRGTLEAYALTPDSPIKPEKNRQTCARSKLLSIATQGARIVAADGDGMLSWFEKDIRTVVRREQVDAAPVAPGTGLWQSFVEDAVRKVAIVDGPSGEEIAMWAGDRIGVMAPGVPREEEIVKKIDTEEEMREKVLAEGMRRVLQAQADEVRFLGALRGL